MQLANEVMTVIEDIEGELDADLRGKMRKYLQKKAEDLAVLAVSMTPRRREAAFHLVGALVDFVDVMPEEE